MAKKQNKIYESNETKYLKGVVWVAIILSLFVPLIYNLQAVFPFVAPRAFFFMAMSQVAFFAWIVLAIKNEKYRPRLDPVTIVVSAFIGSMALSTVLGATPHHSFWSDYERMSGLLIHIHFFAFFLVLSSIMKAEKDWIRIISWITPIAGFVSSISIAHNLGIITLPHYFQNGATLANTSFMGSYLLVAVFFCLYGLVKSSGGWRVFYGANFIIISSALLMNPGGRAMKGGFLIGMLLLFLLYLTFTERNRFIKIAARFLVMSGIGLTLFIGFFALIEGHIIRDEIKGLRGMSARFVVWDMAWEGFKERPILGWGPDNFPLVFQKEFDPELRMLDGGEIWFDRAHNGVFDSLVTVGALGTVLFFGMFLMAFSVLWREFFKREDFDIWAPAVFTSLFVAHFIQNLTVFDMTSSAMLMFVMLAIVASFARKRKIPDELESSKSIIIPSIIAIIVLLVTLNIFVLSPYKANLSASIALNAPAEKPVMDYYKRALEGPVAKNETIFLLAESLITNPARTELKGEDRDVFVEKIRFFIEETEKIIKKSPKTFESYRIAGRMYNEYYNYHLLREIMDSESEEKDELIKSAREVVTRARELLSTAVEISPRNQEGYWDLIQAEVNMGNIYIFSGEIDLANDKFEQSFVLAEKAVELEPRNLDAQLKMLQIARQVLIDDELVERKINEALKINPNWERYFNRENGN